MCLALFGWIFIGILSLRIRLSAAKVTAAKEQGQVNNLKAMKCVSITLYRCHRWLFSVMHCWNSEEQKSRIKSQNPSAEDWLNLPKPYNNFLIHSCPFCHLSYSACKQQRILGRLIKINMVFEQGNDNYWMEPIYYYLYNYENCPGWRPKGDD